ncbi:MAG: hypothetical protein A4E37_00875 [Methanoregulaceae archaeon PtaB.Bin056]|jgi:uncharacterized membrane-anchored protein YitT (DUF2179 family)|nr:MAG: hypothetical protein A4E37_00875 [Methanoregulaceae archaeon PtaB.Bin056]
MPKLKTARLHFTLIFALLLWWAFFAGILAPSINGFFLDLTLLEVGVYGLLVMITGNWSRADAVG